MAKPRASIRSAAGGADAYRIEAVELTNLLAATKEFDKNLYKGIRSNLRKAAQPAVKAVQSEIKSIPSKGRSSGLRRDVTRTNVRWLGVADDGSIIKERTRERVSERTNVRAELARGTGLKISAAKRGGAVTITTSARYLPASRKPMAKLLNERYWRHPVFGDRNNWEQQFGRPYFGSVIWRYRDDLRVAVENSLKEASDALASKSKRRRWFRR